MVKKTVNKECNLKPKEYEGMRNVENLNSKT